MRNTFATFLFICAAGCGGDSTGPGPIPQTHDIALTAGGMKGLWDFSFTSASECGALRYAVLPAYLSFDSTGIGTANSGWTDDPAGFPRWPLSGTIDFKARLMELRFWTILSSVGFGIQGKVNLNGTSFVGTGVDPIPGYTPYASPGECRYNVTGHRRADQTFPMSINGQWDGTVVGGDEVNLTLSQYKGRVSGTGSHVSPSTTISFDVTGTYSMPNFYLDLTPQGSQSVHFTGTVSEEKVWIPASTRGYWSTRTKLSGTLDGSGYKSDSLMLYRN